MIVRCLIVAGVLSVVSASTKKPNIIFVLADDVGWSDFGYNHPTSSMITPYIDELAGKGIQLKQYYTHSVCTPARASLMTGRYHVNTGLTFVLTQGTPAGLSPDIPSMPESFKRAGYSTAMAGKWHLGHAQHQMTPVGRGFDSFTGIFMWDTDSYTKEMYSIEPWKGPLAVDWITEDANGTYRHFAEPRHSTQAITVAAEDAIRAQAARNAADPEMDYPLFLYVAYTAGHSPLQPMPGHIEKCAHIPHLWRREFCGLMVGMDEGVRNLTATALTELGENTIMVITSDNGGSPWFGGMSEPLRGGKTTPLEGGTRVPALIVDFTADQRYLGGTSSSEARLDSTRLDGKSGMQRYYNGLMHVSDWLPTLLSYAQATELPEGLDGFDFTDAFSAVPYQSPLPLDVALVGGTTRMLHGEETDTSFSSPRSELLYEMYFADEFVYPEDMLAYRIGDFKLVRGIVKDDNFYSEPLSDHISLSSPTLITYWLEYVLRALELVWGSGPFDTLRIVLTHVALADSMAAAQKSGREPTIRLFNVIADPRETTNLAGEPFAAALIAEMEQRLAEIKAARPIGTEKVWMRYDRASFQATHVKGDCSMNPSVVDHNCLFTHPWIPNDANVWGSPSIVNSLLYTKTFFKETILKIAVALVCCLSLVFVVMCCCRWSGGAKKSLKKQQ